MFLRYLKNGIAGFSTTTTLPQQIFVLILLTLVGVEVILAAIGEISQVYDGYRFNHLSAGEHLSLAKDSCGHLVGICASPDDASRHLEKIPTTAPEYSEASKIIVSIQQQKQRDSEKAQQKAAASEEQAREQMLRNVQGIAPDSVACAISTENLPIMSFDRGQHGWADDGRCAAYFANEQAAKQKAAQDQRDADAQLYSYWPTTIRVNTDIDSFWLPNEERTCQTYPDDKGRVAVVACNATGSRHEHNIPVTFWGGVDRNTVSDWKCQREGDNFVCKAID